MDIWKTSPKGRHGFLDVDGFCFLFPLLSPPCEDLHAQARNYKQDRVKSAK